MVSKRFGRPNVTSIRLAVPTLRPRSLERRWPISLAGFSYAPGALLPLHNPARIAEDWAVVNSFRRRIGLAFAPGYHPNDFIVLSSDGYEARYETFLENFHRFRAYWRGDRQTQGGFDGELKTFPLPFSVICRYGPRRIQIHRVFKQPADLARIFSRQCWFKTRVCWQSEFRCIARNSPAIIPNGLRGR